MTLHDLLVTGNVLSLFCDFTTPPKQKFLILVAINPQLLFFIINSELNDFRSQGEAREHQVELQNPPHTFLTKQNSWADCFKVIRQFDAQEISRQIIQQKVSGCSCIGAIDKSAREAIRRVVNNSRALEKRFKDSILMDLPA